MEAQQVIDTAAVTGAVVEAGSPKEVVSGAKAIPDIGNAAPVENLDDDPRFRKFKGSMDKQIAELKRQSQADQQRLREENQRLQEIAMRNLSPEDQYQLRERQYREELDRERQSRQQAEQYIARQQVIGGMVSKYGVPADLLEDAVDPVEAIQRVLDYKAGKEGELMTRMERIENDMKARTASAKQVVVGDSGVSSTSSSAIQHEYDEAVRRKDTRAMDAAREKADKSNVTLDRFAAFNRK